MAAPAVGGPALSRRRLLASALRAGAVVGAGTVAAALLDACGGASASSKPGSTGSNRADPTTAGRATATTAPSSTSATARPGGSASSALTIPLISNPTPNPVTVPGGLSSILLNKNLFGQLCRPDATDAASPSPDHAETWEVSTDGQTYTFHLRPGLTFHDGTPLTADDVKFTFDTLMDPKVNAAFRSNLGPFDHAEVVDPLTINLLMKEPYAPLLVMLDYNIMILPKHLLSGQDMNAPTDYLKHPIGSGPYRFGEFVPDDHLTLVANPDYWDGAPRIGTVVYRIVPDANTQVAHLVTGEVDVALIEPAQVDALVGQPSVVITTAQQTNYYYLAINHANPLFADARVRQALAYGLDRQTILATTMRGRGTVADGPISPPMGWAYPRGQQPFPYDTRKARDLLAQAGWALQHGRLMKEGSQFSFKILLDIGNPTRNSFALAAQQYFQKLGMNVQIDFQNFDTWYALRSRGQYDLVVTWWITPPDPDALSRGYTAGNTDHYRSAGVDSLCLRGRRALTPNTRAPIYAQLQQQLYQDQVDVFMLYPEEFRAFNSRVHGYANIGLRDALYYTYRWTLAG
ncbi:MAG TPA: ABC transporter substrate-binding protein [Thermomicrobiaceae bacterium]|nr:ABC transporter substrate-binding protein [Thermomicrobiaceae bacterium]